MKIAEGARTPHAGKPALAIVVRSQIVLGLQLPFAIVPLLRMTNSPVIMGAHAAWRCCCAWRPYHFALVMR